MNTLITVTPSAEVTDDYKREAKTWTKWDSKSKKSFPYNYAAEERVLVLAGSAVLSPADGGAPVAIEAGDAVTFHKGFKCRWKITRRMKKHYAIFADPEDAGAAAEITCDVCSVDCVAESYFVAADEEDICPGCYAKDREKYGGAEHQKGGEPVAEPAPEVGEKAKRPPAKKQKR
jgi:uncharacterized cupin superfamily protein